MKTPEIRKPIFVVGCPRSGTNTFHYRLPKHPDLVWISNVTKKTPHSLLLTKLLMVFRKDHKPSEAKVIWRHSATGDNDVRGRADATPEMKAFLHKVVRNHLQLFNGPRFVNKCPQNALRIEFLDEVFPDAYFIHIVRDGRAVANSIRNARLKHDGAYWGCRPADWKSVIDLPVLEGSGLQWKMIVEHALDAAKTIPPERYVQIRYEDLCAEPEKVFREVSDRVELKWDDATLSNLVSDIESRNYKWREKFSDDEIEMLHARLGSLLTKLGYEV
jgi:hypothetical protein